MVGWIKIHRKTTEHWIWRDPIKFQWWIRMLIEVNHSSQKIPIGNSLYTIERGQSGKSLRSWAIVFGVGTKAVINFFDLLESDKMISKTTIGKGKHSTTLITITNYSYYQSNEETLKTPLETTLNDTLDTTQGKHEGHTNNNVYNSNNEEERNNEKEQSISEGESVQVDFISNESLSNEAQEKEKNSGAKKEKDFSEEAIKIFNDVCRNLPKVEKITPQRKEAINSIIKEHGLETVGKAIQMVADSEFLNGKSESGWKASFDWIFKPTNFNKIIEGNYSNKNQSSQHNLRQSAGDAVDNLFGVNSFGPDPPIFTRQQFRYNTQEAILAALQNKESG